MVKHQKILQLWCPNLCNWIFTDFVHHIKTSSQRLSGVIYSHVYFICQFFCLKSPRIIQKFQSESLSAYPGYIQATLLHTVATLLYVTLHYSNFLVRSDLHVMRTRIHNYKFLSSDSNILKNSTHPYVFAMLSGLKYIMSLTASSF